MNSIITSKSNEKFKQVSKLIRKGPSSGYFVIEGFRALKQALENGLKPEVVVGTVDEDVVDLRVSAELFKKLTDVKNPQGILGVFAIEKKEIVLADKYLILDRISDPGNLGSILRTALAFDYSDVILMQGSVSVYNPKVLRSSLSAVMSMNVYENVDIPELKRIIHGKYCVAAALRDSVNYRSISYPANVSLVIGNEANGVCEEILDMVNDVVKIPISSKMESLNAAIASAILLEYFYNI